MSRLAVQLNPSTEQVRLRPSGESGSSIVLQSSPFWSQAVATPTAAVQSMPVYLRSGKASGTEHAPEPVPPVALVVVGAGFFFPPPPAVVVAAVVAGMGGVGDGIETAVVVGVAAPAPVVSPLESEPHPARTARAAAVPRPSRSDRPTRIGPAG